MASQQVLAEPQWTVWRARTGRAAGRPIAEAVCLELAVVVAVVLCAMCSVLGGGEAASRWWWW
tara:strand:+ start:11558 stop:11746 length:189 start_codon:yes stop_codon:yes gene_type:complete